MPSDKEKNATFDSVAHSPSRRKAAFHAYLEQGKIVDGLVSGLGKLYDSKKQPEDGVKFVRDALREPETVRPVGPAPLPAGSSGTCTRQAWGKVNPGSKVVYLYTLTNPSGAAVRVMPWGATVVGIHVPDRAGTLRDVVLGFDSFDEYVSGRNPCFGAVPGRVANRIAGGAFTLDGHEYTLEKNNGEHHLHGGSAGFHKQLWDAEPGVGASVSFTYTSADGEGGYPGAVTARVTYTWTDDNTLTMDYEAVVEGKPTLLALTNHCYFNLNGPCGADVKDHLMQLKCSRFTPVSETLIPTGEIADVAETPFDFRVGKPVREGFADVPGGHGFDHNLVIDKPKGASPHTLQPFALVLEPATGISMEVATTFPGVQFFTANGDCVKGISGKLSTKYPPHAGFCLETQNFPDAINKPEVFPSPILRPGDKYNARTSYKFGVQPEMQPLIEGKEDASPPNLKWMMMPLSFRPPPPTTAEHVPEPEPAKGKGKPKGKK
mmetsp:Transcript_15856/g.30377  ORF Transcript_15856/g.30377 Transcript_15856/m.30377 type:complete len:491 (+) Transcript_15856:225-1697(+)|eukprot:CAMPEP_0114244474 /NCGR_PEP_ID=MMETSP0058-20121206/11355_1 /TAXON_ID=36894 /ORGANISM="Pyramimonas parkeae, CCMP726" /LENGTH=490 /DNA_ID=CAMNT_0001357409 /DNA_START=219 /DNA_END=1691 /DNA_ORIENTATION=+